jgi:hypothetical protein
MTEGGDRKKGRGVKEGRKEGRDIPWYPLAKSETAVVVNERHSVP